MFFRSPQGLIAPTTNISGANFPGYHTFVSVWRSLIFPDAKTNKPNEVYFVGRSKIVQQDRDIIADKIKMTMNPKDFTAEGNVRTIIHNVDTKDEGSL